MLVVPLWPQAIVIGTEAEVSAQSDLRGIEPVDAWNEGRIWGSDELVLMYGADFAVYCRENSYNIICISLAYGKCKRTYLVSKSRTFAWRRRGPANQYPQRAAAPLSAALILAGARVRPPDAYARAFPALELQPP